ncbi:MAG: hypothetical protein HYY29_00490 [Chloroflexi bacterium]|nr:hypothetical protein [Chloroflexota bacterium]
MKLRVFSYEDKAGRLADIEEARSWDYYDPGTLVVIEHQLVRSYNELLEIASRPDTRDREFLDVHLMVTLTGG